jgi:hypothetical protein
MSAERQAAEGGAAALISYLKSCVALALRFIRRARQFYKSDGVSPVCLASRDSILGPISSAS